VKAARYGIEQAWITFRRAPGSAAMSIGTIAVAFLALGGFLLLVGNLQSIVDQWASSAEMSVYLDDAIDETSRAQLHAELASHPAIGSVDYISKDRALTRFKTEFPELADVAGTLEANPFPASLELRLKGDSSAAGAADGLASTLAVRPGVADVRYDRQWLERLLRIVRSIRLLGLGVAAVLVLGAAFTIAAVVRLSLVARREELDIMQLVGAPFAVVRGPSIAEGALLGGIGAAVALLALWAIFRAGRAQITTAIGQFVGAVDVRFLSAGESVLLLVVALAVGGIAGTLASRN
jgi:cell division transport system permease protein